MKKFSLLSAGLCVLSMANALPSFADEVISTQPEGTVQWYCVRNVAYSVSSWGYVDYAQTDGIARKVVFADNGTDVYFRNPISKFPTDSWVKATIEGNQVSLPLNQTLSVTEGNNGEELVWTIGAMQSERVYDEEWETWRTVWSPVEMSDFTYTYEDGKFTQNDEGIMLALFCNGEYMVYGDLDTVMYPFNPDSDRVSFPEDAEIEYWTLAYGYPSRVGKVVEVAHSGDDEVYIRGFWDESPSATIKGIFDGEKLTISSGQYLGYTTEADIDYFIFFMSQRLGTQSFITYYQPTDEPIVFNYDENTRKFQRAEDDDLGFMVKAGKYTDFELTASRAYLIQRNPEFKIMDENHGQPQAPTTLGPIGFRYFEGTTVPFAQFEFTILPFDLNGNVFNQNDLTYSVWVDGEKVYFDAEDFINWERLPEPTYELPIDFKNNWGIMYDSDNIYARRVQVPFIGIEKIGAQVIYTDPETGERLESLITYYHPDTQETTYEENPLTAVKNVEAEGEIDSVVYYDMLGNRVDGSFRGICVKSVRYTNGKVVSSKVVR